MGDSATAVPVLPSRSKQFAHWPLSFSHDDDCAENGEPDSTLEWELTPGWAPGLIDCKYSEATRAFYKASLIGDAAMRVRMYSNKHCFGPAVREETLPLNQCLLYPGGAAGQPFPIQFQMVYDPQAPRNVTQKVWNAGGITRCEWHPMYD